MEAELMFMIKNDLAEMKYNDFPEISDMQMFRNLEGNWVVTYIYNGKKYLVSNEVVEEDEIVDEDKLFDEEE